MIFRTGHLAFPGLGLKSAIAPTPVPGKTPAVNPSLAPPGLLGPLARFTAAALEVTGQRDVRERLRRAVEGGLADGEADALGADLDLLAVLLVSR